MYLDLTIRFVIVYAMPETAKHQAIADIDAALSEGWMQHRLMATVPLAEIARANELIEQGGPGGCVVVDVTGR